MEAKFVVRHYDYSQKEGGRRLLAHEENFSNIDSFFTYISDQIKYFRYSTIRLHHYRERVMVEPGKINIFYGSREDVRMMGDNSNLRTEPGCSKEHCYCILQTPSNNTPEENLTFEKFEERLFNRFPKETNTGNVSSSVIPEQNKEFTDGEKPDLLGKKQRDKVVREGLLIKLQAYIDRIEGYNEDYAFGFWFFPKSRAINRHINYEVAKWLRDQLNQGADIGTTFNDASLVTIREKITTDNKFHLLPDYVKRDINSSDLKEVIEDAQDYIEQAHNKPSNK